MATLSERLNRGEIVIMDGAVSTEFERHGVAMDAQAWSATAHRSHPDIVRRVHEDYIRAGSQVITANTFATARHVLEAIGLGDETAAINEEAVEIAKKARDNAARGDVWIAGSMSSMPPLLEMRTTPRGPAAAGNYREQAGILAESGADLIVAETMLDQVNAPLVVDAALATGLPVWIGFSAVLEAGDGRLAGWRPDTDFTDMPREDFEDMIDAVVALGGEAAGIMHSPISATGPALDLLSNHWTGPKLAYAETGTFRNPDWDFTRIVSPEDYADTVEGWVRDKGVQIVGGCCGTGPEHIRALKERLRP
ncbi:MAG: homocysteine S-methyltransferase family protein [Kiloniellales bacterium]